MVSYSAPYAVMVHEDLTRHHTNGSAKFLERPGADAGLARDMAGRLADAVRREL
jgi:hypothetical protein